LYDLTENTATGNPGSSKQFPSPRVSTDLSSVLRT
jgi:hypothetical protein